MNGAHTADTVAGQRHAQWFDDADTASGRSRAAVLTHRSPGGGSLERDHEQWIMSWRIAVRQCVDPVGLVELPSTRLIDASTALSELYAVPGTTGTTVELTSVPHERGHIAVAAQALFSGAIDAFHARRHLRRPSGSLVETTVFCRAIRSPKYGHLALWIPTEADDHDHGHERPLSDEPGVGTPLDARVTMARLSADWRVENVGDEIDRVLGYAPHDFIGSPFFDHVHPSDLPALLCGLAEATSTGEATADIRLARRNGGWRRGRAVLMALAGHPQPRFGLRLELAGDPPRDLRDGRVRELERHLLRIAQEVQVAGLLQPLRRASPGPLPHLAELSTRQREILVRLARGDRVPRIAEELYVTESTVRNHLSAIFTKFGVHSQNELLRALADDG